MTRIYLTYDNRAHTDGAGAQLYRIYGIYCLARKLGFGYLHSPLWRLDHQGLEAMKTQRPDSSLVARFNSLCTIPSDEPWPSGAKTIDLPDPRPGFHECLLNEYHNSDEALIVKITHPHVVLDADPDAWVAAETVSPFNMLEDWTGQRPLRIAVHVRRGDIHILEKNRILPNEYYIGVMRNVQSTFRSLRIPHIIELHSETTSANFTVRTNDFGTYNMESDVEFHPEVDAFDDFKSIDQLQYRFNDEPLDAFCRIATADVIVTSISCFSYLAAMLNPKAVTIYHPFFHSPRSNWIVAAPDGSFCDKQLCKRFQAPNTSWRGWWDRLRATLPTGRG
ncbi:MAG TPA: hypothetical protein VK181_07495 [Rhizobium sp.]|nr:hypothetical protein [Rhizobium sp.]